MHFFFLRESKRGSVSSMNATVRSLDDFALLGHSGAHMGNVEVWSSKSSSTEASSPNIRSEKSAVVESMPQGQQGKSRIVARKKSEGEKVNIEKENYHSSVESDVQSSNFLSMQGTYSTSNGVQSERSADYDGDNGNEFQGIQQNVNNSALHDSEAEYKDYLPEHISDDSSREIKGGSKKNGSSTDLNPLSESIFNHESATEALEIEVLKFREIRQDVLVNNPVLDLPTEFTNDDQNPQETSSELSQSGDSVHRSSFAPQSEVLETENRDVETEIEDLFVQNIKAELEYLAMSRAVQTLPEHISYDSFWDIKGGNQNNGSSTDLDPLSESIFNLESATEALEMEVLKFREIRQDVLVNNPVLDLPMEFTNDDQNPQKTSSELSQSGDCVHRFSFAPQSDEVLETENNRGVETEIEDLFMQKIKAEVEYLTMSRAVQNLRVAIGDQITILDEQKTLALKQTQILNKLGDTEKKATMLNKEAEKLEKFCEDIASADEILKLQNRVCKYTTCFFMQLVSLALVLGIFMFQLSPKYVDNIPT